jgi:uncharacterized protein (DUF302 family)
MAFETSKIGYSRHFASRSVAEAKAAVTDALKQQGFGVLVEIDMKDTLKKKIDVDFQDYVILGACNPPLAHQALSKDLEVGLLLPCNVCLWAEEGGVRVAVVRPDALFTVSGNPAVEPVAKQVDEKLRRALESIQ